MLLSVYALSDNTFRGHIEVITSLSWTHRMQEPGDMALEVPYSAQADALLAMDNYVMLPGDSEAMIITYKALTRDGNGVARLQVQGKSFMALLGRRVLIDNHTATETPGGALYWLINTHICTDPSDPYSSPSLPVPMKYPGASFADNTGISTASDWAFVRFDPALDALRNVLSGVRD